MVKTIENITMINNDKNSCKQCKKKTLKILFKCKCNNYYCIKHRYSDCHNCTFDYKNENKKQLLKLNPVIIPSKLESI